ncbi:chaperone protein ClpB1-like [Eucalyptus grandis]|uniref:chaperone protein ClpB1-like n=1 Tax=Eucalyptus grandis TaxID=71139 RepID=UPI00192EE7D7|nr:chaperone protein ClpB1-like [Eucalyptus grandis]
MRRHPFNPDKFSPLNTFAADLVAQASNFDPIIGRDIEINRVIKILSRRVKNSAVLIGKPGVGKTSIVEAVANRIDSGDVPKNLRNVKIMALDIGALEVNVQSRGSPEQRLRGILEEVKGAKGKVILFVDDIHLLLGARNRGGGSLDAANLFKPMLARGEVSCIGATTLEEYREFVEKDAAFERRFQQVHVEEPSVSDTISILRGLKEKLQVDHDVRILDQALVAAAQLSSRYVTSHNLPDKAIDLVDEACVILRFQLDSQPEELDILMRRKSQLEREVVALEREGDPGSNAVRKEFDDLKKKYDYLSMKHHQRKGKVDEIKRLKREQKDLSSVSRKAGEMYDLATAKEERYREIEEVEAEIALLERDTSGELLFTENVGPEHVAEVVSSWTGIPISRLGQNEKQRLLGLVTRLHEKVVGQDQAVDLVAEAILRARTGLGRPGQPSGSFLFLGPTGVGKTELAKAVALQLFDDERLIIRIDMSEYADRVAVTRFIGAPPGYVGHEEGGQLTEAVRRRPYSVVLLDEVEKAHKSVLNPLLQVLDAGRLTDGLGRTVDFTNTVIIMTSNIGAQNIIEALAGKMTMEAAHERVNKEATEHFLPEFLNRLDRTIVFDPLSLDQLKEVARLKANDVIHRLAGKGITLGFSNAALDVVLTKSYKPEYGARPTIRWLEQNVVTRLTMMFVREEIGEGSTVYIDAEPNQQDLVYLVGQSDRIVEEE